AWGSAPSRGERPHDAPYRVARRRSHRPDMSSHYEPARSFETKGRTRIMFQRRRGAIVVLALACVAVMVSAGASSARTSARPSWCGPKKITLGLTDGFGGNSWRLVTTAS